MTGRLQRVARCTPPPGRQVLRVERSNAAASAQASAEVIKNTRVNVHLGCAEASYSTWRAREKFHAARRCWLEPLWYPAKIAGAKDTRVLGHISIIARARKEQFRRHSRWT